MQLSIFSSEQAKKDTESWYVLVRPLFSVKIERTDLSLNIILAFAML